MTEQEQAEGAAGCGCAAAGLLAAVGARMAAPEHWREQASAVGASHLALLARIIPTQPALLPQARGVASSILHAHPAGQKHINALLRTTTGLSVVLPLLCMPSVYAPCLA
jgi:hypothetical protein